MSVFPNEACSDVQLLAVRMADMRLETRNVGQQADVSERQLRGRRPWGGRVQSPRNVHNPASLP